MTDLPKLHAEHDAIKELLAKAEVNPVWMPEPGHRYKRLEDKRLIYDFARICDAYREYIERERTRPDPLGEALNSGDGSYRP